MKTIFFYFFLAISFAVFSTACSDNSAANWGESNPEISPLVNGLSNELYGIWVYAGMEDSLQIMSKSMVFEEDNSGFAIYSKGVFVERANSGWCGTPPISYQNYNGSWKFEKDSLLNITAGYWGGANKYRIKIVSLSETELVFSYIYAN